MSRGIMRKPPSITRPATTRRQPIMLIRQWATHSTPEGTPRRRRRRTSRSTGRNNPNDAVPGSFGWQTRPARHELLGAIISLPTCDCVAAGAQPARQATRRRALHVKPHPKPRTGEGRCCPSMTRRRGHSGGCSSGFGSPMTSPCGSPTCSPGGSLNGGWRGSRGGKGLWPGSPGRLSGGRRGGGSSLEGFLRGIFYFFAVRVRSSSFRAPAFPP